MSRDELSCDEAEELRLDQGAGVELEPAVRRGLERHLAGCAACRAFAAELDALEGDLRTALAPQPGEDEHGAADAARFLAALEAAGELDPAAGGAPPAAARRPAGATGAGTGGRAEVLPFPTAARRAPWRHLVAAAALFAVGLGIGSGLERGGDGPGAGVGIATQGHGGGVVLGGPEGGVLTLDRARVELAPGARVQVVDALARRVRLVQGRVRCHVVPGSGPFAVETEWGHARAVGTEYTVEIRQRRAREGPRNEDVVRQEGKLAIGGTIVMAVGVASGAVLFGSPGNEARLEAGQVGFVSDRGEVAVGALVELQEQAEAGARVPALEEELQAAQRRIAELERAAADGAAPPKPGQGTQPEDAGGEQAGSGGQGAATPEQERERKVRELVEAFDWTSGVRSLVRMRQNGEDYQQLTPEEQSALSKFALTIAELQRALGADSQDAVFNDPRVQAAFMPAWVDGLGADLDPAQAEALGEWAVEDLEREASAPDDDAPQTVLVRLLGRVRSTQALEAHLAATLRPEQVEGYVATVGDDPFFSQSEKPVALFEGAGVDALSAQVAEAWQAGFALDAQHGQALSRAATAYVNRLLALPEVDPSLPPVPRRQAVLERTATLLALQIEAEAQLQSLLTLSPEAAERVQAGSPWALWVRLAH